MSHKSLSVSVLAISVFSFLGVGCPELCTEIGCGDSFELRFFHADGGDLSAGSYDIAIDLGGGEVESLTCVTGEQGGCHTFSEDFYGYAEAGAIVISYYGYDDDPPASFSVSVVLDGETLGADHFEPEWEVSYPNGEDCDPGCWSAPDEELEIERPDEDG